MINISEFFKKDNDTSKLKQILEKQCNDIQVLRVNICHGVYFVENRCYNPQQLTNMGQLYTL